MTVFAVGGTTYGMAEETLAFYALIIAGIFVPGSNLVEEKEKGTTILFSTHIMSEAEKLCDTIAIIHARRILACGSLDELREIVPALSVHCVGGIVCREDGAANPFRTVMAFRAAAVAAEVEVSTVCRPHGIPIPEGIVGNLEGSAAGCEGGPDTRA